MKKYYLYVIEIVNENHHEFEQYLHTIANNFQFTPYQFKAYKAIQTDDLTVNYFIYEEVEYLYSLIKHRYKQILVINEPEMSKVVEINFNINFFKTNNE